MNIFYIFVAILVLLFMITVHEFGHYISGRLLKFKINEFSIGFGKAIYKKTKANGEIFALRIVPLGGYCAFEGEDKDDENPQAFNSQKGWKRLIVLFSGAFFNFIASMLIIFIIFTCVGVNLTTVAGFNPISESYQGELQQAGTIQEGDAILKVDGKYTFFSGVSTANFDVGDKISLTVYRPSEKKIINIEVYKAIYWNEEKEEEYVGVGITTFSSPHRMGFFKSIGMSFAFAFDFIVLLLSVLWRLVTFRESLFGLGGPISTVAATAEFAKTGFLNLSLLTGILGLNLAVFNLLPFPALDGSRMVFVLIEMIRKKPINRKVEGYIHTFGIIFLFAFVILIDLIKIFTGNLLP